MQRSLQIIGEAIKAKKDEMALALHKKEELAQPKSKQEEALQVRVQAFQFIGEGCADDYEQAKEKAYQLGFEVGKMAANLQVPSNSAVSETPLVRQLVFELIEQTAVEQHLEVTNVMKAVFRTDTILDIILTAFNKAYDDYHMAQVEKAQQALKELSAPIVPITDKIAILPLIGDIDSQRANFILEYSLKRCVEIDPDYLCIDLSGVPTVDTAVAQYLLQVFQALSLVGIETYLTGVRPVIAHTIVSLGLDFKKVKTFSSLKQGLQEIQKITNT